ncbi:Mobile element protein [Azospirillum endophyticum]
MTMPRIARYSGYRFPAAVIATAVSLRMVEEMLATRSIVVNHESVRQWAFKFGREIAERLHWRAARRGDKWHLDEVVLTIAGKRHDLWRVVDRDGFVPDVLIQSRGDAKAARRLARASC